jgi:putative ABC transport system permease protein
MPSAFHDFRHGLRALASHPGLTIAAALSLSLAIGAQTSVYCLIDTLFLRPPVGVTKVQRLVSISALDRGVPDEDAVRYPDYLYYRAYNTTFTQLASHFNSGSRESFTLFPQSAAPSRIAW